MQQQSLLRRSMSTTLFRLRFETNIVPKCIQNIIYRIKANSDYISYNWAAGYYFVSIVNGPDQQYGVETQIAFLCNLTLFLQVHDAL